MISFNVLDYIKYISKSNFTCCGCWNIFNGICGSLCVSVQTVLVYKHSAVAALSTHLCGGLPAHGGEMATSIVFVKLQVTVH